MPRSLAPAILRTGIALEVAGMSCCRWRPITLPLRWRFPTRTLKRVRDRWDFRSLRSITRCFGGSLRTALRLPPKHRVIERSERKSHLSRTRFNVRVGNRHLSGSVIGRHLQHDIPATSNAIPVRRIAGASDLGIKRHTAIRGLLQPPRRTGFRVKLHTRNEYAITHFR